jgi:hypothetical protein
MAKGEAPGGGASRLGGREGLERAKEINFTIGKWAGEGAAGLVTRYMEQESLAGLFSAIICTSPT